jgi:hypothetical protein
MRNEAASRVGRRDAETPRRRDAETPRRRDTYKLGNTLIVRLYRGTMWAEGCAWSGVGRYLVWSDIPALVPAAGCTTRRSAAAARIATQLQ